MKCPRCQNENPPESRFCNECGAPVIPLCPACERENPPGSKYCNGCGHDLSEPAEPEESKTSSPLAKSTEGERRQATVLFSDLSGYTAMNERLDPEEVTGIMARFKSEAERIVAAHGGTVNQFVGDEVFALFGIPTAHEDDPQRAVRAALELHEAVRTLSDDIEARLGETLRLHSGINTGLVVTSPGDGTGGRYDVTGDAVNTAARLVAQAEANEILVSPDTRRLITPYFDLEALDPVALKGKAKPMAPYRVVGKSGVQSRFEAAEVAGLTQFTGREVELEQLHSALSKAIAGQGQVITISGEAGLGKSRLAYEFRHGIDREQCIVLEGRCQSYGTATPYLPFLDALRRGLHLGEQDSPEALREKVGANVREISLELEKYLPHYLHLLSIPDEDHPLPDGLEGEALRRELEEALAAIFTENTRHKTMVVIFEDWHWADEASDSALQRLAPMVADFALLLVILHRPEYAADFGALAHHETLALPVLSVENTTNIARSVFGADSLPDGLAGVLHERTGGNPYFAEEVCLALAEEGAIRIEDSKASLTGNLGNLVVPDTVEAVIRSRVDRLAESSREALRLASVIGREFARRLLEAVAEGRLEFGGVLEGLASQDLIRQVRLLPEAAYMFKHALMQGVVYETLLLQQRKDLHGLVARGIEALYADRLEEHFETLAHHYRNSADVEKALYYLQLAGEKASKYFSLVGAREHYREALRLIDTLEMTPERMTKHIDLTLSWAAVAFYSPSVEIINGLETSLNFAERIQDETRLAKVIYWMGRTHWGMGDMVRSLPLFERCIGIAEALDDEELLALPYNIMGRSYLYTAEYTKGIEYLEKGIPIMKRLGNMDEVAYSTCILACIHCWIGNFTKGFALAERAQEIANESGNLTREALTQTVVGFVRLIRGDWSAALAPFDRTVEISRQTGNVLQAGYGMGYKGFPTFMLGQREEGIELMKEGGKLIEATGSRLTLCWIYGWLAESYAASGHVEDAVLYANQVLELGLVSDKIGETLAHRALAAAASLETHPDWGKVADHIEESIRLSQERGERPNLGICYFRQAELLLKKGDGSEAREQLDQATTLFREMEMTWWLEQAEALRGRLERGDPWKGFAPHAE